MKEGDILANQWHRAIARRNLLKRIAFSVDLARVQDWLYWEDYKYANRN